MTQENQTPLQAYDPQAQVAYQPDAVVSRTILDKSIGNVTLFAFDKGQGLSEHTSPYDAMVHILDGQAQIFVEGVEHIVDSGKYIIMPAGKPHSLKALVPFKMMLIMIREKKA